MLGKSLKFIIIFLSLTILVGIVSCVENKNETKTEVLKMNASKATILNTLDSSEVFFQSIIAELQSNKKNLHEIKTHFQFVSQAFEKEIAKNLSNINKLGKEGKITNKEADEWIKEIKSSKPIKSYKKINFILDSLESIK